jgi:hypothetical protein
MSDQPNFPSRDLPGNHLLDAPKASPGGSLTIPVTPRFQNLGCYRGTVQITLPLVAGFISDRSGQESRMSPGSGPADAGGRAG